MSKYVFSVGRCKGAISKIKLFTTGSGEMTVNGQPMKEYFPTSMLQTELLRPLKYYPQPEAIKAEFTVNGGGKAGQVKACRLALCRAMVLIDENLKAALRKEGFMTRDPRVKERKKPGLKRARRAPQWQKR